MTHLPADEPDGSAAIDPGQRHLGDGAVTFGWGGATPPSDRSMDWVARMGHSKEANRKSRE